MSENKIEILCMKVHFFVFKVNVVKIKEVESGAAGMQAFKVL